MKLKEFIINKVNKAGAIMLLLGCAVAAQAQTWQDRSSFTDETIIKYAKANQDYSFDFLSDIQAVLTDLSISNVYVRWDVYNTSTSSYLTFDQYNEPNTYFTFSNGNYSQNSEKQFYFYYQSSQYHGKTLEETFKGTFYKGSSSLKDCILECWVTDDLTTGTLGTDWAPSVTTEPSFKLKIEVIFNETGKKPDSFLNSLKSTGKALSNSTIVKEGTTSLELTKPTDWPVINAQYIRWYVEDSEGNVVDITSSDGVTLSKPTTPSTWTTEADHGYYWHSATSQATADVSFPTITIPSGDDLENYKVVAVLSTEEGTTSGDDLTKEPEYDYTYTFNFGHPFAAEKFSATAEKEFELTETYISSDNILAFDFTNKVIAVLASTDTIAKVAMSESFWDSYTSLTTNGLPFYVRWFIADKNGNEVNSASAVTSTEAATYQSAASTAHGIYYLSESSSDALANIMQVQFNGSKYDITEKDLVCYIATDVTTDVQYDSDGKLKHEPSTIDQQYTFSFTKAEWPGTVKSNAYKHTEVVAVDDDSNTATIPLGSYSSLIVSEFGKSLAVLDTSFHVRYYVEKKNATTGEYEMVANSETMLANNNNVTYSTKEGYGIYWNSKVNNTWNAQTLSNWPGVASALNITFTKSAEDSWIDYRVIAVMTSDLSENNGQLVITKNSNPTLETEPDLNMQYTFTFTVMGDPFFVHYNGASLRNYRNYGTSGVQQYNWINGEAQRVTGDLRQEVHKKEYHVYVDPESTDIQKLMLPFENYVSGGGSNLEPCAYIRWYDWTTDTINDRMVNEGKYNRVFKDSIANRGYFLLNKSKSFNPTHSLVGMGINPYDLKETIHIACDVSKYYDGIVDGASQDTIADFSSYKVPYLIHEPTLSTRYIFHIHPAKEFADSINNGKTKFEAGLKADPTTDKGQESIRNMFNLAENIGRVALSTNAGTATFTVRSTLAHYGYYRIYDSSNQLQKGSCMRWYAFFEDENGIWKQTSSSNFKGTNADYKLSYIAIDDTTDHKSTIDIKTSYLSGDYQLLCMSSKTKTVTASAGQRFHLVGTLSNGDINGTGKTTEVPVVHYEMNLIDAPAIAYEDILTNSAYMKRRPDYMENTMVLKESIDFDDEWTSGELSTPVYHLDSLTTEIPGRTYNHTQMPLDWIFAQYGFCYPSIDNQRLKIDNDYMGISPLHGDYMMLKSMNMENVSKTETTQDGLYYHWWRGDSLYDYTHTFIDSTQYGSFFYVDASDEARTVTRLPFFADLCAGSQLAFTTAVANMTSKEIMPEFFASLYAVDAKGNETRLVSFHTSNIATTANGFEAAKWYQTYGKVVIPEYDYVKEAIDSAVYYELYFDNYALSTNGADYCVDQIYLYCSNSKLEVVQTGGICEDDSTRISVYAHKDVIEDKINGSLPVKPDAKPIYYKIFKVLSRSDSTQTVYEPYKDASIYNNGGKDYGVVNLYKYLLDKNGKLDTLTAATDASASGKVRNEHWFIGDGKIGENGELYVNILDSVVCNLEQGYEYFVALTENINAPDINTFGDLSSWADPNEPCDVYSNFFVPRKTYLTLADSTGAAGETEFSLQCNADNSARIKYGITVHRPYEDDPSGFISLDSVKFDFFVGPIDSVKAGTYKGIVSAINKYRQYETNHLSEYTKELGTEKYDTLDNAEWAVLKKAVEDGVLLLVASDTLEYTLTDTTNFVAIPVVKEYKVSKDTENTDSVDICTYIPLTFYVSGSAGAPTLTIGFSDVTYPGDYTRVIRIGKEQIDNIVKNQYTLHIPVQAFSGKGDTSEALVFNGDSLSLSATTDPTYDLTKSYFMASIKVSENDSVKTEKGLGSYTRPTVDADNMYIGLKLTDKYEFHEGFSYTLHTTYYDALDDSNGIPKDSSVCLGDLDIIIKVVPKYVTWTKEADKTNRNWNNDENWTRSVRDTLYMDESQYKNNADINEALGQPDTYTPMKFTYVTIPTGYGSPTTLAPNLANLERSTIADSVGIYKNMIAGDGTSEATKYIEYDMCVIYGDDGCKGHTTSKEGHLWKHKANTIYDCEKFTGNICKAIYFKPEAELINQQYLTYDSAWVEKELIPNRWYLMSAPLQDTYAGDMYMPYSATTAKNGRQETTAFQPINFSDKNSDNSDRYNRTKYPVYQRSWNTDATVYVSKNDVRSDYSARLAYSSVSEVNDLKAQWGHTYNDVVVPYNTLQGFSIRAHRKATNNKGVELPTALLRLPKSDTDYSYYNYSAEKETTKYATTTVTKDKPYKFVADKDNNAEKVEITEVSALQNNDGYYLVGNPYMASVDMAKFFEVNTGITDKKYWTFDGDTVKASDNTGVIRPLQSFFIHITTAPENITFTPAMMTDGNNYKAESTGGAKASIITEETEEALAKSTAVNTVSETLTLTTVTDGVKSKATVVIDSKANNNFVSNEDVETLFDSNLTDVALVYTVASDQTVSIDRRADKNSIPTGVTSPDNDSEVEVAFSTSDGADIYVLDAENGEITTVASGASYVMTPNDYGRYYISIGTATGLETISADNDNIIISVRGNNITVTADNNISLINAFTAAGLAQYTAADCGTSHSFTLNRGVYVITAKAGDNTKTLKVAVK